MTPFNTDPPDAPLVAAKAALARLGGGFWDAHAPRVTLDIVSSSVDTYSFTSDEDRLCLSGSSASSLVAAFRHYLESVDCGHISRCGSWIRVPDTLPLPPEPVARRSRHRWRFAHQFTVAGYTTAYWDWPRWEAEIDLLAASGVNLALVTIGTEAVWMEVLADLGYSEDDALAWISLPAHQPWQHMGNLSSFGGGMTRRLVEARAALGRRIIDRMTSLDIEPVLPGFGGVVPLDFASYQPDATVIPQGDWAGFTQPGWLDPTSASFTKVAEKFYDKQEEHFGTHRAQAVDVLHEGGHRGGVALPAAGAAIAAAMGEARPDYLWVTQAWDSPQSELLRDIGEQHVLVLDLLTADPTDEAAPSSRPRLWGPPSNFGGRFGMYGQLREIAKLPSAEQDALVGTACTDEGIATNPVEWALRTDVTWRRDPIVLSEWIEHFARARYGQASAHAARAWHGLLTTAYRGNAGAPGGADSLLCAVPNLDADQASVAAPAYLPYPPDTLEVAFRDMERARVALGEVDTFRYDLVDITRQVLSNRARMLLRLLHAAYHSGSATRFEWLSDSFLELFDLMESVLSTREEFMLGPWLEAARQWGEDEEEADALEFDARSLITTWGDSASSSVVLRDYANREWSGLMADYYRPRWKKYLDELAAAMRENREPREFDFYAQAAEWVADRSTYPTKPSGDPVAACRAVHHALPYFEGIS